ncbi:tripartite motif-containing protein 16-like protein isoform X2 [Pygocentrus nattereri]|uniref:tripartite motif-containing protein 16-like protein isoform X2 n=1 Tax=Pygocentrus nattereri TaxID=42514 RepID=UPI0018918A8E|nr:tripartite motif-containing protein 16-like protein isoform X2 [Pygocentrus nattereri]
MDEHSGHKTVSAAAERSKKQKQLVENQRKFQQRIQQTENKLRELRQAMDNLRRSAQAAVEDSEKIFTELIESIERRRSEVKELIRAQEKTELSRAEDLLKKLEQEIADLRRRDAELEQLSHSEDHIHFLQKQLVDNQRKFQQRIQQTENKLQELKQAMDNLRCSAQAAVEDSEKIFTELIESIERRRSEVKELIRAQEKTELSQAEDLLKKLEQEIADLRRRDAELEQLSHSEDHIHFLQSFQSLSAPPQPADLPQITISPQFSMEDLRKAVTGVMERVKPDIVKFSGGIASSSMRPDTRQRPQVTPQLPEPKTREHFLKYSRQLTLDPNTVHSRLILSERNRKVTLMRQTQIYPDHPERFDIVQQVLCRESLTGRCYWEVEFSRNHVDIAVSYKGISRKERGNKSGFGCNNQSWSLTFSDSLFYFRHNHFQTNFSVKSSSSRIGVYVDHSAGILSFYSVSDTMTLLHRVHTTFTQPLYAGFGFHYCLNYLQICDLKSNVNKS